MSCRGLCLRMPPVQQQQQHQAKEAAKRPGSFSPDSLNENSEAGAG